MDDSRETSPSHGGVAAGFPEKMKYLSLHSIPATLLRELKAFKSGVAQLLHQECDRNIGRRKLCIGEKSD
ncbi:hypothetical protein LWI29_031944 [Acer saccharum]|uniref:Uncharacterized protein n=1 Tax=Acer saccharum TaxID=4024 RepID=A0AA39TJ97_ACESA|nr:hypothetical protein LWI29_031944 [Acer saccharum]